METPSTKPVVLVIDADPLNLTALAAALHLSGYEAHCARDSEAALKAGATLALDLIISDVNLDGVSGIELCKQIKQCELNRDASLMFLASHQAADVVRRTHDSEGVFYLRKPFDPKVLLDFVDRALWMPHLVNTHLQNQDFPMEGTSENHERRDQETRSPIAAPQFMVEASRPASREMI